MIRQHRRAAVTLIAVLLGTGAGGCTPSNDAVFTLEVVTKTPVDAGDTVFVAGGKDVLGNWRPDGIRLARVDSNLWKRSIVVAKGSQVEFKITRGSWDTEAVSTTGIVPPNTQVVVASDTTVRITVEGWMVERRPAAGQITGEARYHHAIQGKGIRPRDVVVRLPSGYSDHTARRYPVLYVHDGQNVFDPRTSYTGVDWQLDEHADSLDASGRLKEIIIVGIYNTADRSEEYGDTEAGRRYLKFMVDVLKPMIDAEYRTMPGQEHTAVMGSSMGGLISFLAVWIHPGIFSRAACLSPYFPPGLARKVQRSGWSAGDSRLYIDNGGDELDDRLQDEISRMLPVLQQVGFERGHNLLWKRFEQDRHNEEAWARRASIPLLFMFGKELASQ